MDAIAILRKYLQPLFAMPTHVKQHARICRRGEDCLVCMLIVARLDKEYKP